MKLLKESPQAIALCASDIAWLSGEGNYSHVHYAGGMVVIMAFPLKLYQARLPGFVRIHKQHLINPKFIKAVQGRRDNAEVIMLSGQTLPIARRRHTDVVNKLAA